MKNTFDRIKRFISNNKTTFIMKKKKKKKKNEKGIPVFSNFLKKMTFFNQWKYKSSQNGEV